jgi:hypothetical protein
MGAMSLWDAGEPAPVRPIADAPVMLDRPATEDLRWRSQVVTAPIEQMARAGAHAGDEGARFAERYDLRRIAHRAIDAVVASMGFARELTDTDLVAGMAALASQMAPDAEPAEWTEVAEFVYGHLLNAPDDFAKFAFTGIDAGGRRRPFEFQLLLPRVADAGIAINASPEAINVFLKAFDLDVTDAEVAMSVMLERQISEGRFEAAAATAEAAGRISVAAAARISEMLEDTRRDVGSVDWRGSARDDLARARTHVSGRITEDDRLLAHVEAGTEADDAAVRVAAGQIAEVLAGAKRLHLHLEDRLVRAHRTFLDAQGAQRLARRQRLRLLSLRDEVFLPALVLPRASASRVTDAFAAAAAGPVTPRLPWLAGLLDALLAPSRAPEPALREAEEPDVPDEPDPQSYPEAALDAARAIFATCNDAPRRLGDLLADAEGTGEEDVTSLVWLGALWAYAPDVPEDADLDAATSVPSDIAAGLVALDDGSRLTSGAFRGADLLVGTPGALAATPAPPKDPEPAPDAPIDLAAWRDGR